MTFRTNQNKHGIQETSMSKSIVANVSLECICTRALSAAYSILLELCRSYQNIKQRFCWLYLVHLTAMTIIVQGDNRKKHS